MRTIRDETTMRFLSISMRLISVCIVAFLLATFTTYAQQVTEICPSNPVQPRPSDFNVGDIILTAFDGDSLWLYDVDSNSRYPLPDSAPCMSNCRLSPDFLWLTYMEPLTQVLHKMRLTGTQRTPLVTDAADVLWWSDERLLVWTAAQTAYLRSEATAQDTQYLPVQGVRAIQPGGYLAVAVQHTDAGFQRILVDLQTRIDTGSDGDVVVLGSDDDYFNAVAWSPDGAWLAYVGRGPVDTRRNVAGAELYFITPQDRIPQSMTQFTATRGAVRINGVNGGLSWSPDSRYLAFWVLDVTGPDFTTQTGEATLHLLDISTRTIRSYCGYRISNHTPNPPRLIWSPDSRYIAFAGDMLNDGKPALLLALNIDSGIFYELSNGVYPALGRPDAYAWGYR